MTFVNAALLAGLVAMAIPVIIHLWHRHRFRVVPWGAMMFLDELLRVHRRRIQIEQWLLLALRTLLIGLVVLAMAGPVWTRGSSLAGRAPTSVVMLFDNSLSMETSEAGRSWLDAAKEAARSLVSELPRGSELAVIGMAAPIPRLEEPTVDRALWVSGIDDIEGSGAAARVAESLQSAAGLFEKRMQNADRLLVIVSDFQRTSWGPESAEERRAAWRRLTSQPLPPRIVLMPVPASSSDNVSVGPIQLPRGVIGVNQTAKLRVPVHNWGRRRAVDARIRLKVDQVERTMSSVRLAPGESAQVLFPVTFDRAGSHLVEAMFDGEDVLRGDNEAAAAILVADRIAVLLVSGDPNPLPLRGETAFLELALQPYARERRGRRSDWIEARTVGESTWTPAMLRDVRAVVLANVRQCSSEQLRALVEFVQDGGGMLICPGDRINLEWYRTALANAGLLPAVPVSLQGAPSAEETAVGISLQRFYHPALSLFNDPGRGTLQGIRIRAWYQLDVPSDLSERVVARLETGDPWLVEHRLGAGRILLMAIPCDADWSNLPLKPAYVPLMQELMIYLGTTVHPPRNVAPREALAAFVEGTEGDRPVWTAPDGSVHEVPLVARGHRWLAEFGHTERPGVYWLRPPRGEVMHFVVQRPPEESDLDPLGEAELNHVAAEASATIARTAAEWLAAERHRRYGRELWRAVWWWAMVVLLLELGLEAWLARPVLERASA